MNCTPPETWAMPGLKQIIRKLYTVKVNSTEANRNGR